MLRAGHGVALIVVALLVFGVVMVNSAGLTIQADAAIDLQAVLLGRSTLLATVAGIMLFIGARVPVDRLFVDRPMACPPLWLVPVIVVLLLLVHVPGLGREVNGARRWIELGPFGFQPSEIAKWGMLAVVAWYACRYRGSMGSLWRGFAPPMLLVLAICALIATEDLGTAVLIAAVTVGMLVAAGAKLWHAALLMPIGAAGFVAAVLMSPYRINRLRAFLDPYSHPQDIGYHVLQSMAAINGGGLPGRGLGNSVQKFGYLPEDTTDFIFAIICEELGAVGAAIVISLYACLLLCGLAIIARITHPFARILGLGILVTVGLQALINMAVVTGMAPTKGIALPLLSSGGTGWVLTAFSLGLLVSMDRMAARCPASEPTGVADPAQVVARA